MNMEELRKEIEGVIIEEKTNGNFWGGYGSKTNILISTYCAENGLNPKELELPSEFFDE